MQYPLPLKLNLNQNKKPFVFTFVLYISFPKGTDRLLEKTIKFYHQSKPFKNIRKCIHAFISRIGDQLAIKPLSYFPLSVSSSKLLNKHKSSDRRITPIFTIPPYFPTLDFEVGVEVTMAHRIRPPFFQTNRKTIEFLSASLHS